MSSIADIRNRTATSARDALALAPAPPQAPFSMPFTVGEIVCAKYEIEELLGVGSIGFVVSARRIDLGDKVALKFLRKESLENGELVARFAQEARVAAGIQSEHVTRVLDVGSADNGSPFIVMERLEGRDLGRVLHERGRLPVPVAIEYVLEVCEALAAAHARGIVHRDIKPENLFLNELVNGEDVVKVLDFGISKVALADAFDPAGLVRTSVIIGSPMYMSPEQIRESAEVDARTDIWSLGCVLYELLAGIPAFDGFSLMQLCSVILERSPTPLTAHNPEVTPELEAVVWRCMAKDPAERFQNVAELASALGRCSPEGAQIWVERCSFILASAGPGSTGAGEAKDPPPSRGSARGPASSRRSVMPLALVRPDVQPVRRKPWKKIAVSLAALALAAAAYLLLPRKTVTHPPQVAGATAGTQRDAKSSAAPSAEVSRAASAPVVSISSLPIASSVPERPAASQPLARSVVRQPTFVMGPRKAAPPRLPARGDDEPDVGY